MKKEDRCNAFKLLLRDYLCLSQGYELVVIHDESFHCNLESLQDASAMLSVGLTLIALPYAQQLRLIGAPGDVEEGGELQLPRGLVAAMSAVSGILNVISGFAETMVVRRAIVNQPRNSKCRLAHVPGISDEIIQLLLETDLEQLSRNCESVARAIGNGQEALIQTQDGKGEFHKLKIQLKGWDSEPIISSGAIPPGSWGNVPGGETFCCPPQNGVNGEICINGSVPNHRLMSGEEAVLKFHNGKLVSWSGDHSSPAIKFLENEQKEAERRQDKNWNSFAELGIGLNPAVRELTGIGLFDEKAAGTLHIAIGDNSGFGHDIVAKVHHDMVTTSPTMTLDGEIILLAGELRLAGFAQDALPLLMQPLPDTINQVLYLRRSRYELRDDILIRRLASGHRTGYVRIASETIAAQLRLLCSELLTYESVTVADFLRAHPRFGDSATSTLLRLLYHYRIIGYR